MRPDPFPSGGRTPTRADESNRQRYAAAFPPYNELPFSCRERAAETRQKATDLAREAVGWNTVLDGEGWT
jgi:hypothetical protein